LFFGRGQKLAGDVAFMDALALGMRPQTELTRQQTLKAPISCVGIGLHSGQRVHLTLRPTEADYGIVFRRTDLGADIPARFDCVRESRLATALMHPDRPEARVGTIEHLMAALGALGVDNALVELDGPEVPILDGSALPFVFLIDCAGVAALDAPRAEIEILRPVRLTDGDAAIELHPAPGFTSGLDMLLSIDFAASAIGHQTVSLRLTPDNFRHEICRARTFALAEEVAAIRAAGLGRGGSLDNAVVVDGNQVLNPGGLRMNDEFARHKLLDAVGDLTLAGAPIRGRFIAHRSGHALNNRLLRALFADRAAWRYVSDSLSSVAAA
jgi:UDP-3-O-[3-hydroxymyristoyl] N-acetylglucosamine deacetylase